MHLHVGTWLVVFEYCQAEMADSNPPHPILSDAEMDTLTHPPPPHAQSEPEEEANRFSIESCENDAAVAADADADSPPCDCACVYQCPCGSPCVRCFSSPSSSVSSSSSAVAPPRRVLLAESELSWCEQLFRRQFHNHSIRRQLQHIQQYEVRAFALYVTYFHFRSRGYILRDGLQIGTDFVAYPLAGPEKWHAQFGILVGEVETIRSRQVAGDIVPHTLTNANLQATMRTMHICIKQKKVALYARVLYDASASSSITGDVVASASPSHDLLGYSVTVFRYEHWFARTQHGIGHVPSKNSQRNQHNAQHTNTKAQVKAKRTATATTPATTTTADEPPKKKQKNQPPSVAPSTPSTNVTTQATATDDSATGP